MAPITETLDGIAVSNVSVTVPSLGSAKGVCLDGKTCQYFGIPYATVPGRFRRPQPAPSPWPDNGSFDATYFRPYCPQPPRDFYPIPVPPVRPWAPNPPPISSDECLNLNISVPFPPSSGKSGLPVMIFMHGGAFTYAAGSAAMYDGRALADISRDDEGTPTIIISINYRLGVFGFLASKEIREYNASFGEDGVGNYGIHDQVEALRWVKQHISAFGGDPERVTLFGQSAGAVSTNIHLMRNEPLFSSAILQSGLMPLCGIMTEAEYQVIFDKMLEVLHIPLDLSSKDRLQRLLAVPDDEIVAAMVPVFMTPVITLALCDDGVLLSSPMPSWSHFTSVKFPSWCPRVMIGDAGNECIIWNKAFRTLDGPAVQSLAQSYFSTKEANEILAMYRIDESTTKEQAYGRIEKLTTDAMYLSPNYDFMRAAPTCYAYHFDELSHYENEWKGLAHHSLENIYIWNVLRHTLKPDQQRLASIMAGKWLGFANGKEPWAPFGQEQNMMIFGGKEEPHLSNPVDDKVRGYQNWQRIRELGGKDLVERWGEFSFQLCILKREILDRNVRPAAIEVPELQNTAAVPQEPGVL
ncbi:hypothetical protein MBLNU459_g7716t1 [Dothideomycetes sp. NU459]